MRSLLGLILVLGCTPDQGDDLDGDGYGAAADCDDADAQVYPGAPERCGNGIDDDCDGTVDVDGVDPADYFPDSDGDGYGDASEPVSLCKTPESGFATTAGDCADGDPDRHPGVASDDCNDLDDDCDGDIDEDAELVSVYADADGDGYGQGPSVETCDPRGFSSNDQDCNDADAGVHPGALERCNLIDDDCNARIDEGVLGRAACPAESCKQIVGLDPDAKDGSYVLDLGEVHGNVSAECRMTSSVIQGWTIFDTQVLNENGLVTFSLEDGEASDWRGEWVLGRMELYPKKAPGEDCMPVVLRAAVELPWEFDAWYGDFSANYRGYDIEWAAEFGTAGDRCTRGAFLFGAHDNPPMKRGGEWGLVDSPTSFDVRWDPTVLDTPTDRFQWELHGAVYKAAGSPENGDSVAILPRFIAVH